MEIKTWFAYVYLDLTCLVCMVVAGQLRMISVPNRPVRPALGTAGLTQAFSETAGPDCGKAAFQKKSPARPG